MQVTTIMTPVQSSFIYMTPCLESDTELNNSLHDSSNLINILPDMCKSFIAFKENNINRKSMCDVSGTNSTETAEYYNSDDENILNFDNTSHSPFDQGDIVNDFDLCIFILVMFLFHYMNFFIEIMLFITVIIYYVC